MRRRNKLLLGTVGVAIAAGTVFAIILSRNAACPAPAATAASGTTMQAVRIHCYGGVEAMTLERVPVPVPAKDELLVRVHAAGVNPLDWHFLHGKPYVMRLSSGIGRPDNPTAGRDFAGTIEAVGADVRDFRPGDAVFGARSGAFAEYLLVREGGAVVRMPDNIDFEQAAAVPVAAVTALQAVRDAGQVRPGQRVLVNGASGGVGTYAVQIAKALGGEVTGVSSGRNTGLVRSLGADHALDYAREDFTRGGRHYDVIIDNVGNHPVSAMRDALHEDGILVMVTGPKSNDWLGPLVRLLGTKISSPFVSQTQITLFASVDKADLAELRDMLADGRLRSVVDQRFALDQAAQAITYLEQGRTRGKNVIVVGPAPVARLPASSAASRPH